MDENIKEFLFRLNRIYELSQEDTLGLIEMYGVGDKDPLNMKISAREEVIGDVLETLSDVGIITNKEALEWAESFDVAIGVEI